MNRTLDFGALTLRFMDYFFILAVAVFFGAVLISGSLDYSLIGGGIVAAAIISWIWWRTTRSRTATLVFLIPAFAMYVASTSGTSVLMTWMSSVLLFFTFGRRAAQAYVAFLCLLVAVIHTAIGSPIGAILAESVYALMIGYTGLALAYLLERGFQAENERQQSFAELQVALRDSRELALAQERERVAASLHDGLGHRLTSIGLSLDYAARMIERDPHKAREEILLARGGTTDALNVMRSTVRAMNPVELKDGDLVDTLGQIAASFANTDLHVTFASHSPATLDKDRSVLALRFVQEALTNVVRHADADQVEISFDDHTLSVSDNGRGNDAPADFGLTSLEERAAADNAIVDKQPHGGIAGGFRISLTFPEEP